MNGESTRWKKKRCHRLMKRMNGYWDEKHEGCAMSRLTIMFLKQQQQQQQQQNRRSHQQ